MLLLEAPTFDQVHLALLFIALYSHIRRSGCAIGLEKYQPVSIALRLAVLTLTFRLQFLLALRDILPKYPEMFLLVLAR